MILKWIVAFSCGLAWGDVTGDRIVNIVDLVQFIVHWRMCPQPTSTRGNEIAFLVDSDSHQGIPTRRSARSFFEFGRTDDVERTRFPLDMLDFGCAARFAPGTDWNRGNGRIVLVMWSDLTNGVAEKLWGIRY